MLVSSLWYIPPADNSTALAQHSKESSHYYARRVHKGRYTWNQRGAARSIWYKYTHFSTHEAGPHWLRLESVRFPCWLLPDPRPNITAFLGVRGLDTSRTSASMRRTLFSRVPITDLHRAPEYYSTLYQLRTDLSSQPPMLQELAKRKGFLRNPVAKTAVANHICKENGIWSRSAPLRLPFFPSR